jgi:hypothetical protein
MQNLKSIFLVIVAAYLITFILAVLNLPTVALEVKQVPFATLYTRSPDGLQMGTKNVEA